MSLVVWKLKWKQYRWCPDCEQAFGLMAINDEYVVWDYIAHGAGLAKKDSRCPRCEELEDRLPRSVGKQGSDS